MRSLAVDALLYGASAAIAVHVSTSAPLARNRTWGAYAWPAYAAGGLAAIALAWVTARRGRGLPRARLALALCVLAGAVALPLANEVRWRFEGAQPGGAPLHPYAASEVVVTEGAAAALLRGRDPYSARFTSPELAGRSPSIPEHFPYLPGMAVFGAPGALLPHSPWTDARIFFALVTALAAAAAFRSWRAQPERRLRALQVLVVLPTGAAALVAGGDDMPVLALSLLALVLFERGRHVASAVAVAAAGLLKVTAWPLLAALAVSARDGRGRRLGSPLVLAAAVVVAGVLVAVAAGPAAFVDDVLLFPAGLTALPSPAASTTVGSTLVHALGGSPLDAARVALTSALLAVALLVAAAVLIALARARAHGPARSARTAAAAGTMLLTLVVLAPVARVGYLVYPIDLLVWAVLLHPPRAGAPAARPAGDEVPAW